MTKPIMPTVSIKPFVWAEYQRNGSGLSELMEWGNSQGWVCKYGAGYDGYAWWGGGLGHSLGTGTGWGRTHSGPYANYDCK